MPECVYANVTCVEELEKEERVEVAVEIYESAEAMKGHDPDAPTDETDTKGNIQTHHTGLT